MSIFVSSNVWDDKQIVVIYPVTVTFTAGGLIVAFEVDDDDDALE